jgi:hypothetical protein
VVERSWVSDMCFTSPFHLRLYWDWITWNRTGTLGGCSPHLCRLRPDGLAPASKYWAYQSHANDMGPVSIVACRQQNLGFSLLLLGCSGREARYGPADWSVSVLWVGREPFFLEAVDMFKSVSDYVKGCYALTAWDTYGLRPYADWAWDACGVLVGFPL